MPSNEVANLVLAQVTFTAANPPVIIARNSNVSGVTRLGAGIYRVDLVDKLPPSGNNCPVNFQATPNVAGAASFASAGENGGNGNIVVNAKNLAGVDTDTAARIDVLVTAYPTVS